MLKNEVKETSKKKLGARIGDRIKSLTSNIPSLPENDGFKGKLLNDDDRKFDSILRSFNDTDDNIYRTSLLGSLKAIVAAQTEKVTRVAADQEQLSDIYGRMSRDLDPTAIKASLENLDVLNHVIEQERQRLHVMTEHIGQCEKKIARIEAPQVAQSVSTPSPSSISQPRPQPVTA